MSAWKQTLRQTLMRAGTLLDGVGVAGSVRTSISDVLKGKHDIVRAIRDLALGGWWGCKYTILGSKSVLGSA
jgi:hypothetical protein